MNDLYDSRFIIKTDPKKDCILYKLPRTWWSRSYEYAWASLFVKDYHVVLDSGCGISHPFKFYLSDQCKELYACDIDNRILSPEDILKDIENDFGKEVAKEFPEKYFNQINYIKADLKRLPFKSKKFDLIYCISVLEHLPYQDIKLSLEEFKRTLKDVGLIVLTFDYPSINLEDFRNIIAEVGLEFAGNVSFQLPKNAITSNIYSRLYCFRAVLRKHNR